MPRSDNVVLRDLASVDRPRIPPQRINEVTWLAKNLERIWPRVLGIEVVYLHLHGLVDVGYGTCSCRGHSLRC